MSFVAGTSALGVAVTSVTTPSIDTTAATLLFALSATDNPTSGVTVNAPTDSKTNTWSNQGAQTNSGGGTVESARVDCVFNPVVGTAHTFTGHLASAAHIDISVGAWSATDTAQVATDAKNWAGFAASATGQTSNAITTTNANDLLVAAAMVDLGPNTIGASAPFTYEASTDQSGNDPESGLADRTVSATGSYSASFTWATTSAGSVVGIFAFKLAGAATAIFPPQAKRRLDPWHLARARMAVR